MDIKTQKLLESLNSKKIGIFYDDSNLYHAYQKYGWRVDVEKFRRFFERYCEIRFLNYYLVIPASYELKNYVVNDKSKKIVFVGYEENMAWELRQCWHIYVNRIRDEVGFNKKAPSFTSG